MTVTYVVTGNCVRFEFTDCISVCPDDCLCKGETTQVVHPDAESWKGLERKSLHLSPAPVPAARAG